MKKNLFFCLSFATILMAWCTNSDKFTEIDPNNWLSDEWLSVQQVFDNQIENAQYLKDLENYISYDILSSTENKPFTSDFSLDVKFDDNSSVQWWVDFSQKKVSKNHDLESRDIEFNVLAMEGMEDSEPFESSGSVTLLYQDNEMYANLHNFGLFMWEWNMVAKMYSLLWEMIIGKWVNLEINDWWIVSVDTKEEIKLQRMIWTITNVLKTSEIYESPNFLGSVADLLDTINSRIDLWISTNALSIKSVEDIKYSESTDWIIQKEFVASFQWWESSFDLSFVASQGSVELRLYNMKEFDTDLQEFKDLDSEFLFSLKETKKSEYDILFQSVKYQQTQADFQWNIDYDDTIKFEANFVLEPIQLIAWQKISWRVKWEVLKQSAIWDEILPVLSWDIVLFSDLISSL